MVTTMISTIAIIAIGFLYLKAKFEINELHQRIRDLEVKNSLSTKYYESVISEKPKNKRK